MSLEWSDSLVKCSTNLSDASNQTCLTVIFLALNDKWLHYFNMSWKCKHAECSPCMISTLYAAMKKEWMD